MKTTSKSLGYFSVLGVLTLLAACTENVPNDKLTYDTILSYAKNDELDGLVVDDFKKENGWQDTSSENKYNVRYTYNLKLTKPLPEVVLELASSLEEKIQQQHKNPGFMGVDELQTNLNIYTEADNWVNPQKDTFPTRSNAFLLNCKPCSNFLSKGSKSEIDLHWNIFIVAWSELEKLGFKDDARIGDKVPRQAWSGFMKTENGWKPIITQ
ncbi:MULTISPECIES: hypothetical protein [Chromobacterium]|uniref:hypothetical protein n=1 Tax=Chromobacterium TaxID=535 RepID=UPI00188918AA|nr:MULTISPECIES: hypothetical protein [Chromobacterium]WON83106.1 hypothetical protein OK026_18470 [Chromobacterium haemolyticum]